MKTKQKSCLFAMVLCIALAGSTSMTALASCPPFTVSVSATPSELWPPNHKYVTVNVAVSVVDICGGVSITLLSVTSNEPDNGLGDGNTNDDIVIIDDYTFELRSERSGLGSGRIYTITYDATDYNGNSTQASVNVLVPLNKSN